MSKILIICQARMESQRFPQKVVTPICGQPLILWLLSRLASLPYSLVVATPSSSHNADLGALCERHGVVSYQVPGDPNDVLARFTKVVELYPDAEHIVRLCGDTPLLDSAVVEGIIRYHLLHNADYTGLAHAWGDGNDVEVFTRNALLHADFAACEPHAREHCSPHLWTQPDRFRLAHFPCPFDLSHLRCSVDTKEDLLYVQMILERCLRWHGFSFGWREVWWQVEQDPTLREYMAQRPMNGAYLTQVGTGKTWEEVRYER